MNEVMYARFDRVKSELQCLFPGKIDMVYGVNKGGLEIDCDDYIFTVSGLDKLFIAYLKMRFNGEEELLALQLYRENQYELNKNIRGIFWFRSEDGKYKKPNNHQELERFLNHVWGILN